MTNNKVLVIGSNSFSGSHFVKEALNNGNNVWGVSRSDEPNQVFLPYKWIDKKTELACRYKDNFVFNKININRDFESLKKLITNIQPEIVVNFAAQGMVAESWLNPTHWYQTNVVAQVALHDELRKLKNLKKYVHVTTPEVYGSTDSGWIKENSIYNPSTPYAVSRAACDMHLMSFLRAYEFPVVFTRSANVYGPGQQLYRIVPRTMISGRCKIRMNLHGGGKSKRAFIHIEDVVKATMKLALEAEPGSIWHLSSNEAISIKGLVRQICELTDTNINDIAEYGNERLGKDQNYLLDSSKMRQQFNWKNEISLEQGLKETLNWIDENLEVLKGESLEYVHKG